MFTFVVWSIFGCDGGKAAGTGETGETGDVAAEGADALPDYSDCTYTKSVYDGPDGVLLEEDVRVYGDEERLLSYRHEDRVEGTWSEGTYTYDEAGCVEQRTYASGFEDVVDFSEHTTYVCERDGTWSEAESRYSWLLEGEHEPQVWTQWSEWDYEWEGDQIVREHRLVTHEAGYLVQETLTLSEWEGAREVHQEFGSALSGDEMEWAITDRTYDDAGWLTRVDRLDLEGVRSTYTYGRDALGRTTQVGTTVDGAAVGTWRYRWEPDHFRLEQATWDAGDDGALDQQGDYVCAGEWPWTCGVSIDLGDGEGGPIDGVVDSYEVQAWSCSG